MIMNQVIFPIKRRQMTDRSISQKEDQLCWWRFCHFF